ncbi:MAG: transglutaminase-like domain-containing protein [Bacteroidota bacterium]
MEQYLSSTYFFDFEHRDFQHYLNGLILKAESPRALAIELYYAVRDGWWYDPYDIYWEKERWQCSSILKKKQGHCIDKAILLVAALRAKAIPARLHFAKVKNHIAVEQLVQELGTDELTPHAYAEVWLDGRWVAATPAFNKALCEHLGVAPLEFDGQTDSVFQQFDTEGNRFMEYLDDYGSFADLPLDFIINNFKAHYPVLVQRFMQKKKASES